MEEEDLWCVASVLRCECGGRFTLTLARRSVARDGLQVLLRSHRLQTEHSGTVAAYRMAMAGELSTALSSEAVATNDAERLAESVGSTRKLHASTAGIDTRVWPQEQLLLQLADCGWLQERFLLTSVQHQLSWTPGG